MRRIATLLFAVAALGSSAALASSAAAAEFKTFSPAALKAAQDAGRPIIVHVTAGWCSTCAAQIPIVKGILKDPKFKNLVLLDLDFDKDKADVRKLGVQAQSTFVAFHGKTQVARSSGDTEPKRIAHLFDQTL